MPPRLQAPARLPLSRPVLELLRRHERIQGPGGRRGSARGYPLPETGSTPLPPRHCEQEGWQVATVPRGDCQRQRQGSGRLANASEAQPRQVQSPIEHVQGRVRVAGWHHDVKWVWNTVSGFAFLWLEFRATNTTLSGIHSLGSRRPVLADSVRDTIILSI